MDESESPRLSQHKAIHNKVFTGSILMMISRLLVKSIGLVSSVILARLLIPEDFGIVAIAMAVYAFVELFGAFGFGTVLIQKQQASADDYHTAWTFKLLFGVFAASLLFVLAPLLASYYQEPRLTDVIRTIGLMAILSGCNNIGVIDFQKQLDFRRELKLQVLPKLLSFCCTMVLAFNLRSYWALVYGMLINEALNLLFSYRMSAFRPRFSLASAADLFSFSKWLLLNNLIDYVNRKIPVLLTGQLLDSKSVGLFTVGEEIALLPTAEIAAPVNRATYPVYARLKDMQDELRKAYLNTLNLSTSVSLPAAAGIAVLAPLLVPTVLGPNWAPMAAMMQWLAIAGFIINLSSNVAYVFMATGSPRYLVFTNTLRALVFVPALLVLIPLYGLTGIGYALLLTALVLLVVTHLSVSRLLALTTMMVLRSIARALLASLLMCVVVWGLLQLAASLPALGLLLLAVLVGVGSYGLILLLLWWLSAMPDGFEKVVLHRLWPARFKDV